MQLTESKTSARKTMIASYGGFKNGMQKFGVQLQRLGKSLMFPIAVLPIAALLNRIGSLMTDPTIGVVQHSAIWWIGQFVTAPGAAVFNNIALIFGIGVAFGLAKDYRGEAALCGGISYMILTLMTGPDMVPSLLYSHVLTFKGFDGKDLANPKDFSALLYVPSPFIPFANHPDWQYLSGNYDLNTGVIGGITCGCVTAWLYNKYKSIQLPEALSFFSGRRFVPMVTVLSSFVIAWIFAIIWPWIQYILIKLGTAISTGSTAAPVGAGIYAIFNRLLQPFGAHHILNTFLWFQLPIQGTLLPGITDTTGMINAGNGNYIVFGDITAFNKGIDGSGIFQAGFFPVFLGGIPATGVAMIMTAEKGKRKEVGTFIMGVAAVAFLTGIDEPIVFIWIFLSPLLLLIHAVLTGIFAAIVIVFGIRLGFGFSAGLIDYLISVPKAWTMSLQHTSGFAKAMANPLWIFPISIVMFIVYYPIWHLVIVKTNLQTPGRENIAGTKASSNAMLANIKSEGSNDANVESNKSTANTANFNANIGADGKPLSHKEMMNKKYDHMAQVIYDAVGKDNFKVIEYCATRLRLVVKDNKVDCDKAVKAAGIYQVIRVGTEQLQLIVGTDVEHVADRLNKLVELKN